MEKRSGLDFYGIKPSFVIVVDVGDEMFAEPPKGCFREILRAIRHTYKDLFFLYPHSNPIALLLTHNDEEEQCILVDFKADTILTAMKTLEAFLVKSDSALAQEVADKRKLGLTMSTFLFFCQRKFAEVQGSANVQQKLFFITRSEAPVKEKETAAADFGELQIRCRKTLRLMRESGIETEFVVFKEENCDVSRFYGPEVGPVTHVQSERDLKEFLVKGVHVVQKRTVRFYWCKNEPEKYLLVDLVSLTKPQRLLKKCVHRRTLHVCKWIGQRKNNSADKYKIRHPKISGFPRTDTFIKSEVKEAAKRRIRNGLHLMAVKPPQNRFGFSHNKRKLAFLSPKADSEDATVFKALWSNLQEKGRTFQCFMQLQRNHKLSSTMELSPLFVDGKKCFLVRHLVSLNNVRRYYGRDIKESTFGTVTDEEAGLVSKLVDALMVSDFHPMQMDNPRMEQRKAYVMAKFMDMEFVKPPSSLAKAREEVKQKTEDLVEDFKEKFVNCTDAQAPKNKRRRKENKFFTDNN